MSGAGTAEGAAPAERAAPSVRNADKAMAAIAALLLALAGWAAWKTETVGGEVPDDAAWRQAAALVRAEVRPGDLIVFAPGWIDPVGRMHLGDLMPLEDWARMDAARFSRIWELSIRGAAAPEAGEGTEGTPRPTLELEREVAGITVRRYAQQPAIVVGDAVRALPSAKISGPAERGGPSAVIGEVEFLPRRCVQVVPAPGRAVTLVYPAFPLGSRLVLRVGLADAFTRRDIRVPGHLELKLDGARVVDTSVGIHDGWMRFEVPTRPGTGELTVIASAPGARARDRLICFALESRR